MKEIVKNNLRTLDDCELLVKKNDGYYYPANPVYSNIKLEKSKNKYMVKNINDFVKKNNIITQFILNM